MKSNISPDFVKVNEVIKGIIDNKKHLRGALLPIVHNVQHWFSYVLKPAFKFLIVLSINPNNPLN